MSDVVLAPQQVIPAGLTASYTGSLSASNVYQVKNDGRTILHVKNAGGSPCVVTVATQNQAGGLAITDQTYSVAAGAEGLLGPFPRSIYNEGNDDIDVSFSFITSVTVAALHI